MTGRGPSQLALFMVCLVALAMLIVAFSFFLAHVLEVVIVEFMS